MTKTILSVFLLRQGVFPVRAYEVQNLVCAVQAFGSFGIFKINVLLLPFPLYWVWECQMSCIDWFDCTALCRNCWQNYVDYYRCV